MATTLLPTGIQFPDNSIQTTDCRIKSVQSIFVNPRGSVNGDYGSNAVDVTISAVDTSKSMILHPSAVELSSASYLTYRLISMKFLNSSTIQISCDNISSGSPPSIRFQVVEFE